MRLRDCRESTTTTPDIETRAAVISGEGEQAWLEITTSSGVSDGLENEPFKEKIELALYHAQTLYRQELYAEDRRIIENCISALQQPASKASTFFHQTFGRAYFMLGQTLRHMHEYKQSRAAYEQTIEYCFLELQTKSRELHDNSSALLREQLATDRKLALCFIGLGSLLFAEGRSRSARPFALAARAMLLTTEDWVHKAYVDLLIGSLERSFAGFDKTSVIGAIKTLKAAYDVFHKRGHEIFKARTGYELAMAWCQLERYDEAEASINEVLAISRRICNKRWQCNALIVQSRILRCRMDPKSAMVLAAQALEMAQSASQSPKRVASAFIALGECRRDLGLTVEARHDFKSALRTSSNQPLTSAVCHLHLAECYLQEGDLRLAERNMTDFNKLEPQIDSGIVQDLAKALRTKIDSRKQDFSISRDTTNLSYEEHIAALRAFLIKEARRRYGSNDKISDALGVTRQTLYNWLHPRPSEKTPLKPPDNKR